jgi:hypothetical protein
VANVKREIVTPGVALANGGDIENGDGHQDNNCAAVPSQGM